MLLDAITQVVIGLLGTLALFLTIKGHRAGYWLGLGTQPFWVLMALKHELYGVLMVSLIYCAVWGYGLLKRK